MISSICRPLILSGLAAVCVFSTPRFAAAEDRLLEDAVGFAGGIAFLGSGAPGLVIAAVRDGETAFAGFGEISKGSGKEPDEHTLMRIASISKVFCGDLMVPIPSPSTWAPSGPCRSATDRRCGSSTW
jgi:D-alanyl-D-alanine-carboxypeptidase/D-alanyl-D-alanine-endopeptidase